jgi:Rha family phage regulatory protein|nr:MAG TPA: regulatory protein [Bacteriophage sp.]
MANAIISANAPELNVIDGLPVVSSLALADHFEKEHRGVLRDIRVICEELPEDLRAHNFVLSSYDGKTPNGGKRTYPMYLLTRDGFTLVAMGFTGKKALAWKIKYIQAFNEMERALLEGKHGEPVTLPHHDTLTATEQAQLQAIVQAKAGMVPADMQRKAFAEMWTRFNRHFRIARYAQLPPAKMGEAVEYLVGMEVKAAVAALPSGKQEIAESPIQARVLDQFPKDMGTGRKQALKKIEGILKDFYGLRDTVRLFTHPGGYSCGRSMDEKDRYDILLNLYRAADANLAAAYNALEAGYRLGREIGRG